MNDVKIQILSDLHLEHGGIVPEHHPQADVIVLAGDPAPYTEGLMVQLAEHRSSAPHILYVLGNHEFYGTEIDKTRARSAEECAKAGIHLLDPGMVRMGASGSSGRRSGQIWCSKAKRTRSGRTCESAERSRTSWAQSSIGARLHDW